MILNGVVVQGNGSGLDSFHRIKVRCDDLWHFDEARREESIANLPYIPVLNDIQVSEGDTVVLFLQDFSEIETCFCLGKVFDLQMEENIARVPKIDKNKPQVFSVRFGNNVYIDCRVGENGLEINTASGEIGIDMNGNISVHSNQIEIKSGSSIKIDGGVNVELGNVVTTPPFILSANSPSGAVLFTCTNKYVTI